MNTLSSFLILFIRLLLEYYRWGGKGALLTLTKNSPRKTLKPTIFMYVMLLIYHTHFDILKDNVNTVSFNATVKQLEH